MAAVDVVLPPYERYTVQHAGAVASVTRGLSDVLTSRGFAVRVVTPRASGARLDGVEVRQMRFALPRTLRQRASSKARRVLARNSSSEVERYRHEASAIVRHSPAAAVVVHNDPLLAATLGRENPARTVALWLHNMVVGADGEAIVRLPDNVRPVAVSEAVRRWTASTYGVPADRIDVVHNGVDATLYRPAPTWPAPGSVGSSRPVRVVCHGRIDPNKGQVLAARAVAQLREEGVPVDLTIVGQVQTFGMSDTAMREYLDEFEHATRSASAHLAGWVPGAHVPALLRTFDVALVLPTVPEPFSLTGLEAMASGLAVIAVPAGGVAEWVGEAAVPVEPRVEAVANALRTLVTEKGVLRDRQLRCRARSLDFTWDRVAGELPSLLNLPRTDPATTT